MIPDILCILNIVELIATMFILPIIISKDFVLIFLIFCFVVRICIQIDGGHSQRTPSCHMLTDVSVLLCYIGDLMCTEMYLCVCYFGSGNSEKDVECSEKNNLFEY